MHTEVHDRIEHAQAELTLHRAGVNSSAIVDSLWTGLSTLRTLLLARLHEELKSYVGADAAWAPPTLLQAKRDFRHAAQEIDIYSLVVVQAEALHSGYAAGNVDWFRNCLMRLRWGDEIDSAISDRLQSYEPLTDGQRRRKFASLLEQALPEATKAPLIIYRLYPRAVRIATALAFGDLLRAREIRSEQVSYLPVIADCHHCHGQALENGEICPDCGNPLWKIDWLCATE